MRPRGGSPLKLEATYLDVCRVAGIEWHGLEGSYPPSAQLPLRTHLLPERLEHLADFGQPLIDPP